MSGSVGFLSNRRVWFTPTCRDVSFNNKRIRYKMNLNKRDCGTWHYAQKAAYETPILSGSDAREIVAERQDARMGHRLRPQGAEG